MTLDNLFARKDMYSFVATITPRIAEDWLLANTHNRELRESRVNYFIGEIKAGRWRLTHQGIAFGSNRVLLDGQHRLWAIALSDASVPALVAVNVPPESLEAIDVSMRSVADILTLDGSVGKVTSRMLGVLRAMFVTTPRRRSPGEERDLLVRHDDAVHFAVEAITSAPIPGVATAVIRGVLARAWYSADLGRLREFAQAMQTCSNEGPVGLLIQHLIRNRGGAHGYGQRVDTYRRTERALSAFLVGEQLTRLHPSEKELFPLPEEAQQAAS